MKATNLIFVLLVAVLVAASFALWGCASKSSSSSGSPSKADDDNSGADDDNGGSVTAACEAFLAKCNLSSIAGESCNYYEGLDVAPCFTTALSNYFNCLSAAGCVPDAAWETCATNLETASLACE
jgi:hypothetical protein